MQEETTYKPATFACRLIGAKAAKGWLESSDQLEEIQTCVE